MSKCCRKIGVFKTKYFCVQEHPKITKNNYLTTILAYLSSFGHVIL